VNSAKAFISVTPKLPRTLWSSYLAGEAFSDAGTEWADHRRGRGTAAAAAISRREVRDQLVRILDSPEFAVPERTARSPPATIEPQSMGREMSARYPLTGSLRRSEPEYM
jgi:hypothetical protein